MAIPCLQDCGFKKKEAGLAAYFCIFLQANDKQPMDNREIARLLRKTAALIELTGGNPYRARAFETAARTIRELDRPVGELLVSGDLLQYRGIGPAMAEHIREILSTGTLRLYDSLKKQIPEGLLELLEIKGIGPKKLRRLWLELGITSVEELETAGRKQQIAQLPGFGPRTQARILESLQRHRRYRQRRRLGDALPLAERLRDRLASRPEITFIALTGELRRCMETVEAIDFLLVTENPEETLRFLETEFYPHKLPDNLPHPPFFAGKDASGTVFRFFQATPENRGTLHWLTTGAPAHCAHYTRLYHEPPALSEEVKVYTRAELPYIVPELREDRGELEAAVQGQLPRLITYRDLKGALHNHTNASDGQHTLLEMAQAAQRMGLSYLGIADHSQSLRIANGLSVEQLLKQRTEIQRLNERFEAEGHTFRILSGTECDILADGSLDYPEEVLAQLDYVVVSIHQGFNMTRKQATARLIRAIEHPHTTILGHMTGRLLLIREGYPVDHRAIIRACQEHEVAIELNANPYRLDIDWRWIREATEAGVLIAINPDAHHVDELAYMHWGVRVARKGWLTPEMCLNARSLPDLLHWLHTRKQRKQVP